MGPSSITCWLCKLGTLWASVCLHVKWEDNLYNAVMQGPVRSDTKLVLNEHGIRNDFSTNAILAFSVHTELAAVEIVQIRHMPLAFSQA